MFKQKFYNLDPILKKQCQYNLIIGERSNGKTYSVLLYGLRKYVETGQQMAYVRRWREDFIGKRGSVLFDGHVKNGEIEKLTHGEYNGVYYFSSKWFLCLYEDGERVRVDEKPFCYAFSIASAEHDKSTSYPDITTICFDEFLTRKYYLPDEFVQFMNLLSTIIRQRNNVKIFMLGNTVNYYAPYFSEMGIKHIKEMQQGDIDIYTYGDSKLQVAVELCKPNKNGKQSDFYFAFDNPKLSMITGGYWEVDLYPHCPCKYTPKEVYFKYFIDFNNELLECEIVRKNEGVFTFIHPKTTDIKDKNAIVFSLTDDYLPCHFKDITRPYTQKTAIIWEFFKRDLVFYSDNNTGEVVKNYLNVCRGG